MKLTISMATFDDYDGVYFTIQSIRLYHRPQDCEFLILDNNPDSAHGAALRKFLTSVPGARYIEVRDRQSSWVKYDAFKHAMGDIVLGLDCHLLLYPGFFHFLRTYFDDEKNRLNMLTGPVVFNELNRCSSCMDPKWNKHDFGTWGHRPEENTGIPFEIPMQGMGCFAIRRDAWKPISPHFVGFGAEEWYMAEHVRRSGGKVECHPLMRWVHRFAWPKRSFPLKFIDKVFNYYVGWLDLYGSLDHPMVRSMTEHWMTQATDNTPAKKILDAAQRAANIVVQQVL